MKVGIFGELIKSSERFGEWSHQSYFGIYGQKATPDALLAQKLKPLI